MFGGKRPDKGKGRAEDGGRKSHKSKYGPPEKDESYKTAPLDESDHGPVKRDNEKYAAQRSRKSRPEDDRYPADPNLGYEIAQSRKDFDEAARKDQKAASRGTHDPESHQRESPPVIDPRREESRHRSPGGERVRSNELPWTSSREAQRGDDHVQDRYQPRKLPEGGDKKRHH